MSGLGVASADGAATIISLFGVDSKGVGTSAELVCAPPLLLTVTPGATCVVEEVAPTVAEEKSEAAFVAAVDAESEDPDESVPAAVGAASVAAASVAADGAAASDEELDVSPVELDESAMATPGAVTTITPIPRAAASAPTRPMYRP